MHLRRPSLRELLFGLGMWVALSQPASAQSHPVIVRLTVVDTLGAPVASAEAIAEQDGSVVGIGRTDSLGQVAFSLTDSATYHFIVRRIGYRPGGAQLSMPTQRDTLRIVLARGVASLDSVLITESALPKAKQPYIDSTEIAATTRGLYNLGDVIRKLRPDLYYQAHRCVAPRRLYVNGRYIPPDLSGRIRPEHIQSVRYVNCFDNSIPGLPPYGGGRLFVVLKYGYGFNHKVGSYKADESP